MNITERLWQRQVNRNLDAIRTARPTHAKVRIFGTPAGAQQRLLILGRALVQEGYEIDHIDQVAASPFFTVTDAHLKPSPIEQPPRS